jgi:hypothetical protein
MKACTTRILGIVLVGGLLAAAAMLAQDIPLTNWTVPAYRTQGSSGGLTTMTDISNGVSFTAVSPCRLVDTRQAGFPAGYGTPALVAGAPRNFDLNSDPLCTGIPTGVEAYSLNITVTNTQGPGFILIYPQGGAQPPVSTLNYVAGQTVANAAVVPSGTGGGVTVIAGVSGTDLIIDINGYFASTLNSGQYFEVRGTYSGGGVNYGQNFSSTTGSAGVRGHNNSATGQTYGVWGQMESTGKNAAGVRGTADANSGITYGVSGHTDSTTLASAGVWGTNAVDFPTGGTVNPDSWFAPAGVRSTTGTGRGIVSIASSTSSVAGTLTDSSGNNPVTGYLGLSSGGTLYAGYFSGPAHVQGTFTSSNKLFVQPHPTDPTKEIRYVSLEGPASEVYFRGTAQVQQGITRIAVPEYFRLVARKGSYSTIVTPVGGMATVAVFSEGDEGIIVQASRNVKIHYVVYAERDAFRDHQPIVENTTYRPQYDGDAGGLYLNLPDSYKALLIGNGTLKEDGTVNVETARRVGWQLKPEAESDMRIMKSD